MAISAISSGLSGMHRAVERFEHSAARVARFGTGLGGEVDLASEMVNVLQAKHDFEASTKVVKAVNDMHKSVIDILA